MRAGCSSPAATIVEGTAGNTGIGLAVVGNAMGFRTVIVIPDTQSQEKKDALRLLGAELIEVPAVPYKDPNNYVKISGRLAEQLAQNEPERRDLGQPVRQCRQPPGPYRRHGPGNLAADRRQGRRLRLRGRHRRHAGRRRHRAEGAQSENPHRRRRSAWALRSIPGSRPASSKAHGTSITEGIGQGRVTANLEGAPIDDAYQIPDEESAAHHLRPAGA